MFIGVDELCVKLAKCAGVCNLPYRLYSVGPDADENGRVSRVQQY